MPATTPTIACYSRLSNGPWPVDARLAQVAEHLGPALRHLRQHVQARTDVLAALRVVRRQRRHRVRPRRLARRLRAGGSPSTESAKTDGSPPTSVSEPSRV